MIARRVRASAVEEKINKLCENLTVIYSKIEEIKERQKQLDQERESCIECRKATQEDSELAIKKLEKEIGLSKELGYKLEKEYYELCTMNSKKGAADLDNVNDFEKRISQLEKTLSDNVEKTDLLNKEKEYLYREMRLLAPREEENKIREEQLDEGLERMMCESSAVNNRIHKLLQDLKIQKAESDKLLVKSKEANLRADEDGKQLRAMISKNKDLRDAIDSLSKEKKRIEKELKSKKMEGLIQTNMNLEGKVKGKEKLLHRYMDLLEENAEVQKENEYLISVLKDLRDSQALMEENEF